MPRRPVRNQAVRSPARQAPGVRQRAVADVGASADETPGRLEGARRNTRGSGLRNPLPQQDCVVQAGLQPEHLHDVAPGGGGRS